MKKTILFIVLALSAQAMFADDLTQKGEFQVDIGGGRALPQNGNGSNFGAWGANLGWGVWKQITLFGEFDHNRLSNKTNAGGQNVYNYDGGAKVSLKKSSKVEPYALVAFGGGHFPGGQYVKAVHLGGGTRIYLGGKKNKWGIAPEFRWIRFMDSGDHLNTVRYTGGIFVQWGK